MHFLKRQSQICPSKKKKKSPLPSYANVNRVFFPLGINGKITEAGLKSHFKMYPIF